VTVLRAADAPTFELPGARFTVLASPSRGSADICTWKLTVAPGRDPDQPHTVDADEIFMVISGTVRATPGGESLNPGDAVIIKAGDPIQLVNTGDQPAELYVAIRSGFTGTMADGTKVTPPWAQ
jgi:mannose-6-phosphate isomerase-like protein (cupin superfamily)